MNFPASVASYLPVDIARMVYDYGEEKETYDKVMFELMSDKSLSYLRRFDNEDFDENQKIYNWVMSITEFFEKNGFWRVVEDEEF
jgi:aromatic ring-opening dioxygenase LigB subunit